MSRLNPSRYVSPEMHSGPRPISDADLPDADPHLFTVEDPKRQPDQMRGLFAKKGLPKTKARIAARPTGRADETSGGAVLALAGFGLLGLGLIVGAKQRK